MMMVMVFAETKARIDKYAQDKVWYWHVPLWLFGLFVFIKLLGFDLAKPMPFVVAVPHSFDFMLHEFAHILTGWLPPLMTAAAGSFSELLLGGLLVYGAFKFRNYFASLFCCLWLMLACLSVGNYMADAVPQRIPLVSLGGAMSGSEQTIHDWHFIFGELHMLGASSLIGGTFRVIGILIGLFGLVFSAWIMYKMAVASDAKRVSDAANKMPTVANYQSGKASIYPNATKGALADRVEPPHATAIDPTKRSDTMSKGQGQKGET